MPTISILLPVYNAVHDLPYVLNGLLQQTYTDFEVIAVNDGSTDGSGELLDYYAANDKRFKVVHQSNAGLGAALNRASEVAIGTYLARQDADDVSAPTRLERQICYMQTNRNVGLCGTWAWFIDEKLGPQFAIEMPDNHYLLLRLLESGNNPFVHGSVMIRKSIYDKEGIGYRGAFAQDFDLWLRLSSYTELGICTSVEYYYWLSSGSVTYGNLDKQRQMVDLALKLYAERRLFGKEKTDWTAQFTRIQSLPSTATHPAERQSMLHYTRGLYYLRCGEWISYRSEMQLASQGAGVFADKATKHRLWAWAAPATRIIYRYMDRRGVMRYTRFLSPGTQLPKYVKPLLEKLII